MINEVALRDGLKKLLKLIKHDIRQQLKDDPELEDALKKEHAAAAAAGRAAAGAYSSFRDDAITQAAVHWLLACVFVRFLEDNHLIDEAWIAGPGDRLTEAQDRRSLFYREHPRANDHDYLQHVFERVSDLPDMADLFHREHNPLWRLAPTGPQAMDILRFFQQRDESSGGLLHDFTEPAWGTRFLGDLYQNLSDFARKRYALCQTPGFVIDFILDRTLTPAISTFGLDEVRIIDPTCGSGHFLLAAFDRLYCAWQEREPSQNERARVQRVLDAVYGVDLNPFAVAIARFRMLVAALKACGIRRLLDAPDFRFRLATGDSLLHGIRPRDVGGVQTGLYEDRLQFFYETEDSDEVKNILSQPYHVAVGNPPYINVDDPVLREAYRSRFRTCRGQYQLGVPFMERFLDLTLQAHDHKAAGYMGMIVSNAFMTRSFGRSLIEEFLLHFDLTHIIDMSGLNLPGHGTPTAIILARNQVPLADRPIRAVRGIVGIQNQGEDLAASPVWQEILLHVDESEFEGMRVSIADAPRHVFSRHPWVMGGGGAAQLKSWLDEASFQRLSERIADIGVIGRSSADEIFFAPYRVFAYHHMNPMLTSSLVSGECVRDWHVSSFEAALFPEVAGMDDPLQDGGFTAWTWPYRTSLGNRATFSQQTYFAEGRSWWGWHQVSLQRLTPPNRLRSPKLPLTITSFWISAERYSTRLLPSSNCERMPRRVSTWIFWAF